jgi:hypothetical protein
MDRAKYCFYTVDYTVHKVEFKIWSETGSVIGILLEIVRAPSR